MNIFKRISNLWKLTEYEPANYQKLEVGTQVTNFIKKPQKMAQIIKRRTLEEEIEEILK